MEEARTAAKSHQAWVIIRIWAGEMEGGAGRQPGTLVMRAQGAPYDRHMTVHGPEHQPTQKGGLEVQQYGPGTPKWYKEHVTAVESWAHTTPKARVSSTRTRT